jgi:ribosomal protection tetracycline resistance protein
VVSFVVGDTTVNLVDTPGHPDFIAEVERVLGVLDGAVLVVSAVEGVQSQTRVLFRALRRLHIPTLIVVNKIDRRGARDAGLVRDLAATLSPDVVALGAVADLGTRDAAFVPGTAALTEFLAAFDRYRPAQGPVPERARSDHNPFDRREYLLHVLRRV